MECGGTGKNRWWSPTLPTLPLLDHTEPYNWVGTLVGQFEPHSSTMFLTKVSLDRLMSHLMITGHCQSLS